MIALFESRINTALSERNRRIIMRKTKIVCTLGPASGDEATMEQLILAGMDAAK